MSAATWATHFGFGKVNIITTSARPLIRTIDFPVAACTLRRPGLHCLLGFDQGAPDVPSTTALAPRYSMDNSSASPMRPSHAHTPCSLNQLL
jgi:hypothetical protein